MDERVNNGRELSIKETELYFTSTRDVLFARVESTISQFPAFSRPPWKSYRVLLFVSQELNLLIGFSAAARVSSIASLRRAGVSQGACLRRFSFRATIAGALEVTIEMSAAARRPRGRASPSATP